MSLTAGNSLTSGGNTYTVIKLLGAGGQGEVYCVKDNSGREYALKWYFPHTATDAQKYILNKLVVQGSPDPCFLWPLDFITDGKLFGYIMPLRPNNYKSIIDMVKRRAEPSFLTLCKVGFNLTNGYQKLHSKGYSYRDISFGNLFFDENSGDILICDNDNVSADGDPKCESGVYGTPRFMAPEIVRGEAKPSRNTDRYSLAVLLFYMFMMNHPLEGKLEYDIHCMDINAQNKLFGFKPLFIFDPVNASNRPVPGYQDNALEFWPIYPKYLQDLFTKSFTDGLKDPAKRITEPEWMDAFANMISSVFKCPHCGADLFYDPAKADAGEPHVCWYCKKNTNPPAVMNLKKQFCLMEKDRKVFSHQIHRDGDIETIIGTVVSNPNDPTQIGLRNETQDNWTYIRTDGTQIPVPPSRSAKIATGCSIKFGTETGVFR